MNNDIPQGKVKWLPIELRGPLALNDLISYEDINGDLYQVEITPTKDPEVIAGHWRELYKKVCLGEFKELEIE